MFRNHPLPSPAVTLELIISLERHNGRRMRNDEEKNGFHLSVHDRMFQGIVGNPMEKTWKFATVASTGKDNGIHPYAIIDRLVTHHSQLDSEPRSVALGSASICFFPRKIGRSLNRENLSSLLCSCNLPA